MMDFIFRHLWLESSFAMMCLIGYMYYDTYPDERSAKFHNKSDIGLMTALILLGPIGVTAVFIAIVHEEMQGFIRMDCRRILAKWEKLAQSQQTTYEMSDWEWHKDKKHQEVKYTCMRETVGILSDKELKKLLKTGEDTMRLDKELLDAVANEIIHREIAK
jgi:hypothetical protein